MGYRKLEHALVYDWLQEGADPSYSFEQQANVWYLGLAGESASDVKITKITLPMLSRSTYDWQTKLQEVLIEAISLKPQKHVDNFAHAFMDFSTHQYNGIELSPNLWFASKDTKQALTKQVKYAGGRYLNDLYYDVDRKGVELDIPNKLIVITPQIEDFGVLSINEDFFNFMFIYDNIQVYRLRDLKISDA